MFCGNDWMTMGSEAGPVSVPGGLRGRMSMLVTRQLFRPKGGTWSTDHSHTIKQTVRRGSDAGSYSLFQCYIRVVIEFSLTPIGHKFPNGFP